MCTHFTSASNITYDSDNSLYSSMLIDYELKDGNVTMFGKFSGPLDYTPYLIIDDAQGCTDVLNNTIYCGYPLFPSGNKLLVFLSEYFNYTQIYGYANRIIIRENQALMAENKPFTQTNMCQTFNSVYDSNRNLSISTKSCCTFLQDLASPSPVSATTTTSGSKSFSNFNFLTLFLSLIAAFGIFKV
uniref:CUB domain-containing protein n=1 Tax=Panagrolaimus davidi TaxID=227884 RepID=A0A914Q842_9BILA